MKEYTEGVLNSIKLLDDEVQRLRAIRDESVSEAAKIRANDIILSHILSIQHLREAIQDEEESED